MRGGIKIPLGVSASRLTDEAGKFLGIIVILRDFPVPSGWPRFEPQPHEVGIRLDRGP
jgi:hypothetical protein